MNIETKPKIGILFYLGISCGAFGSSAYHSKSILILIITIIFAIIAGIFWAIIDIKIENILKRLKNK